MRQNDQPRFSIVIPAYNEEQYIAATLESLKNQDFKGTYEVIVVDNNSTDKTVEIAESLGAQVVAENKPGVCSARQKGTEIAEGEIVISSDADTVFAADWLSNIDKTFQRKEKYIGVAGPCTYVGGPLWGQIYPKILFGIVNILYKLTGRVTYITATNIAFKKEYWEGYNTELTQGGDELDLLRNLQRRGKVVFNNRNSTYTSPRRLERGFIYNFFVTFFVYYFLEYNLNRLFGRRILGSYPAFRNSFRPRTWQVRHVALTMVVLTLLVMYTRPGHTIVRQTHKWIRGMPVVIERFF